MTIQSLSGTGFVNLDGKSPVGGQLLILSNASGDFGGVLSGNGALDVSGGTETLTGANTYTGTTDISNGTLALAGNGSIADTFLLFVQDGGTWDISRTNNGAVINGVTGDGSILLGTRTLTLTDQHNREFSGTISGTGGLTLPAGSVLSLTGPNTYTGSTTIDAGASLILGDGSVGAGGSIIGDVLDNGSLTFNRGSDITYGGAISGAGSLVQAGLGTLTLTGTNTNYSGATSVSGGSTVAASRDANLGAISSVVTLNGGTLENTATFTLAQPLVVGNFSGTLETDASTTLTITNPITGIGGLTKTGTGSLVLVGSNTYQGAGVVSAGRLTLNGSVDTIFNVNAGGTLVVNGHATQVDVDTGGTLSGTGSIGGDVFVFDSGTVVSQGTKPAQRLTINGNLYDSASGTTAVALGNPLRVVGTAYVAGTMKILPAPTGYSVKSTENLITAGYVAGTFANLTLAPGVFYAGTLSYTPTQVNVNLTQTNIVVATECLGIVDPASESGAQRVQDGFETINAIMASGGAASPRVLQGAGAIQHSATPAVAHSTLNSLSGQLHAASAAMLFDGIDAQGNALSEHFDDLLSGQARPGIWYSNLGWQGDLQRSGYAGATFRSGGGMAGADMHIGPHALLGFSVGQSTGFGQLDAAWDHNRTWMNNVAMYGGLMNGPWYISAQIANGWYREDMQRLLQLGALGSAVSTASAGHYLAGMLEGGRLFQVGGVHIKPFADVRYQHLDLGGFAEQGGLGYGLKAGSHTTGRLQAGLGLRATHGWRLDNGMYMAFDGGASWQHTLRQDGSVFDASFTGFNNWLPVEGIGLSRNIAVLRAGLSLWPIRDFGLRLGFMREQGQRENAGSAMLQGTMTF